MTERNWGRLACLLAGALLVTACSQDGPQEATPTVELGDAPGTGEEALADEGAEETAAEEASAPQTVEEVLAAIAAMDLSEEERREYLYEKAVEEGEVLFYSSMNVQTNEAWAELFRGTYPEIDLQFVGLGRPADLLERIRAEARAGRHLVDVFQGATVGAVLEQEGFVAAHHGVPVPPGFPAQYVEDLGILLTITPQVIAWNTNLVSSDEAPRTFDDFLEPQHAGCVFSGGPTWVATMIVERGYDGTEEWMQRFIENDGVVEIASTGGNTRNMAAGEFPCMVYAHTHTLEPMIVDDGAPLDWYAPDPTPAAAQRIYISQEARHPHAAALYVHWVLSEQGAQVIADDSRIPLHPGIETSYERLRGFSEPGSDLQQRLRPLRSDESLRVEEQALELIERYALPSDETS